MPARNNDKNGDKIDRLFQLPLDEFTAARNELAKEAGSAGADIRALPKPNVPAWAVNQLYWRERRVYDKLIRDSERLRAAHAQSLAGKNVDLPMIELQHKASLKAAADAVRSLLAAAGDAATPATLKSVVDTLQALPGGSEPGRLTRPLAPIGFGALGALMKGAGSSKALAEVVTFAPPKPKPDEIAEANARARELKRARAAELSRHAARAKSAVAATRAALDKATRVQEKADRELQAATAEVTKRRTAFDKASRDLRVIDEEREQIESDLHDDR